MNEENNNFEVELENQEETNNNETKYVSEDIIGTGNIISNGFENEQSDEVEGPLIINEQENEIQEDMEAPKIFSHTDDEAENIGPMIIDSNEIEENKESEISDPLVSTGSFKDLEKELDDLKNEKNEIEEKIQDMIKRKDELNILIKNKQEELDYKKEVEVTTDKLKTYIRDLEVKPGAVRDALATLINNMND